MSYKYRLVCDGVDVDVGGRTLHIAGKPPTEKAIQQRAAEFALAVKDERPPEPEPDYRAKLEDLRTSVLAAKSLAAAKALCTASAETEVKA